MFPNLFLYSDGFFYGWIASSLCVTGFHGRKMNNLVEVYVRLVAQKQGTDSYVRTEMESKIRSRVG